MGGGRAARSGARPFLQPVIPKASGVGGKGLMETVPLGKTRGLAGGKPV